MTDRSIIISAPMALAILTRRKTQIRRPLPQQPRDVRAGTKDIIEVDDCAAKARGRWKAYYWKSGRSWKKSKAFRLPLNPGDRLYVGEPWRTCGQQDEVRPRRLSPCAPVFYTANQGWRITDVQPHSAGRPRQARYMPRWASRFTLLVRDVRIERLQEIREEDAVAEGVARAEECRFHETCDSPHTCGFRFHWQGINARRCGGIYAWNNNPWVTVITFEPVFSNIDAINTRLIR